MKLNRNVVEDLLPVYLSGEASKETNQLVEAYLEEDPELNRLVQKLLKAESDLPEPIVVTDELTALKKTQQMIKLQSWLLPIAILFTAFSLSIRGSSERGVWWAWEGTPIIGITLALLGLGCWIAYFRFRRQLRTVVDE